MHTKPVALHLINTFLQRTCVFIYTMLQNSQRYATVGFAIEQKNEQLFVPNFPVAFPTRNRRLQWFLNRIAFLPEIATLRPDPLSWRSLDQLVRDYQPALIHAHFGYVGMFALAVQQHYQLPLVVTFYGNDTTEIMHRYYRPRTLAAWYEPLFANADLLLTVSDVMGKDLVQLGAPASKVATQRLAVNLERFTPRPPPAAQHPPQVIFMMVSGFTPKKGIDVLLRAFAQAHAVYPKIRLRLIGDGPTRVAMEQLAQQLGIDQKVSFEGYIANDQLPRVLKEAHIFVHPSVTERHSKAREGLPTAISEAMATAMPVISTRHAGIPELVHHGANGLLVDEFDVQGLAASMVYLATRPDLWGAMGQAAHRAATQMHNLDNLVAQVECYYDRVRQHS